MKTTKNNTTPFIRFRRWSRAGYAVFCSLACAVTIGCVDHSISDKSLQKAVGISKTSNCALASESESQDKVNELQELEAALSQNLEIALFDITTDRAAACVQGSDIYFIYPNG